MVAKQIERVEVEGGYFRRMIKEKRVNSRNRRAYEPKVGRVQQEEGEENGHHISRSAILLK